LRDFLLLPGVEESDTITFDANGKISFFCKYGPQTPPNSGTYTAAADMVVIIGKGSGVLDPRLFASEVILGGWPNSGPDTNKSIKVTGANLASGSKLLLHGFGYMAGGVGTDTVPYYIYSATANYNPIPTAFDTYTYP
jgi:hypothetical protein